MKVMVTGGAGFIGSSVVRHLLATGHEVVTVDALTYSGRIESLADMEGEDRHVFERVDICDRAEIDRVFSTYQPEAVLHLAAETHVDRSIDDPIRFVRTNVEGTVTLLAAALDYHREAGGRFRFHHVSTDEVFGSLGPSGVFDIASPYRPRSPYSASKAASDHFVRAYHHTFGLPVVITNCSNNYGPRQFPEKLIPHMIIRALEGRSLPVYGTGANVRDWLYVSDHAEALALVLTEGTVGETYLIGGGTQMSNMELVGRIADLLDEAVPGGAPHRDLIELVKDRPGHDFRYAIDHSHLSTTLGWRPRTDFETGLAATVEWYLANRDWWQPLLDEGYRAERIGLEKR